MKVSAPESRYATDSAYVCAGFGEIKIPEKMARTRAWHALGELENDSLGTPVATGLKTRGAKFSSREVRRYSARLAEELIVIAALEKSGEFDDLLLPLFMGVAVDQRGHEVGLLTEDVSGGDEGYPVTNLCQVPVGSYNIQSVLQGMKRALRESDLKVDDYGLNNHALFNFGDRLAACDLEDILYLADDNAALDEYQETLHWVREGNLHVPVYVEETR